MRATSPQNATGIGEYTVFRPSLERQLAIDAFAAIRGGHPIVGLLELDVTDALTAIDALRRQGARVSLFAFTVRAIAIAISEHPDLNLVRHGKRLVCFEDVDVSVPVEVWHGGTSAPREVVVRRAQHRSVSDIFMEIEAARLRYAQTGALGDEDRWGQRIMRAIQWLPAGIRVVLFRLVMRSAFRIKTRAGTTLVTSVGKFGSLPGHAFTFSTGPRAAVFVIGSVAEKPWLRGGQVVPRSILSISIIVDHDLVDGAPAARFARRLQELIESAAGLELERKPDTADRATSGS